MTHTKKLIEVTSPLDAINKASMWKSPPVTDDPSTPHLWWVPRPMASARAVIFAQMLDDPSAETED